ncbi:pisatin demethylase [Fusarium flagelliforme]|uniref:Pisatin demethylase n=1 Tax=Fusarium flagelliforme TaxID=2675880 RepID=A0A395N358_9HYPO|nr:pisatin demethylase [Fusarium flagelliforme]
MSAGNISKASTQLRMAMGKEKDSIFLGVIYDPKEFILILFLATVTYLVISSVRQFYRLRHFQGPAWAAWTKLWLLRTVTSGRMHQIFYTTTKKYGSIVRIAPNSLMTSDATLWRRICAVRSPYVRADWYKGMRFEPDKDVILTYRDEKHMEMRSKLAAGYAGRESENLEKSMDSRIAELLRLIKHKYTSDDHGYRPFDWGLMSSNLTLDVVTELGFSHCIGNIESNSDRYDYYGSIAKGLPIVTTLTVLPWIVCMFENSRVLKWIMPSTEDKHGYGRLLGFAKKRARERFGPEKVEKRDMLGSFIRHGITQKEAEAETIVQMMAGTDLAATVLRVAVLYIITQPQAHRGLLDEFHAYGLLSERPSETIVSIVTASKMPYLQACIKESLRICPPFCGLLEKVVPPGGDVLADGRVLPEGTHIGVSFWGMMRDPDVFGDDADVFRPERWIHTEAEKLKAMEKSLECVFSPGRYTCLGKDMAILQVNKVLVEFLAAATLSV